MNLLGPELVRDLVSLIERAEADQALQVLVFKSADPDYLHCECPLSGGVKRTWLFAARMSAFDTQTGHRS